MLFRKTTNKLGHRAFTLHEEKVLSEIITDCQVSIPYDPRSGKPHPPTVNIHALWDTGATHCAITQKVIKSLNLIPFTKVPVGHATGSSWQDAFKLNILLPNDVGVVNCNATECVSINGNFDIIIGMDLITKGDFAITNQNGKSVVSFRMPSQTVIDFNEQNEKDDEPISKIEKIKAINYSKTPQNALCPCGSGKQFKRCHGVKK